MNLLPVTQESLEQGAKILLNGGLVAFPTETVYGLGADAFNPQALAKVFEVKNRPHFDPLIIHIASIDTLEKVSNLSLLNEKTRKRLFLLAENFLPGPLSIVLPKNDRIPGIATSGLPTAAIRFPDNDTAQKLIALSSAAVAAPSANPFGGLSPTKAEHVVNGLGDKVDLILDGGSTRIGLESTVLDITGETIKILRPGGTPKEAIEELIGAVADSHVFSEGSANAGTGLASPGQLKSHYAPKATLFVLSREDIINQLYEKDNVDVRKIAYLFFDGSARDAWLTAQKEKLPETVIVRTLSESGQTLEAASRLFEILHELDNSNVTKILAQSAPQHGIGEAINDRLRRGSA